MQINDPIRRTSMIQTLQDGAWAPAATAPGQAPFRLLLTKARDSPQVVHNINNNTLKLSTWTYGHVIEAALKISAWYWNRYSLAPPGKISQSMSMSWKWSPDSRNESVRVYNSFHEVKERAAGSGFYSTFSSSFPIRSCNWYWSHTLTRHSTSMHPRNEGIKSNLRTTRILALILDAGCKIEAGLEGFPGVPSVIFSATLQISTIKIL